MDIEKYLTLLNDEINKNANGHLSLNSRVQLMRKINSSNIVNKIYYTCVVKIAQMNVDMFKNNIFNNILLRSKDFLYNSKYDKS
ncbi:Imm5 family immunity protein, partial [Bacteroides faecis]